MSTFATASGLIPEYQKSTHRCIPIKDEQLQQGLNAPAFAFIRAPLLDFDRLLMANDSEGCSSPDLEGTPSGFLPDNELRNHSATSKSANGVSHTSRTSTFLDPTGEDKDSIKDEAMDGTRDSRKRATDRRADGSRRSATQATRKSARLVSSKISKTPIKAKSDKKKQAKPEVKAEDQGQEDEEFDIERIVCKAWGPEAHPGEWCYCILWEQGGESYEPCVVMRNSNVTLVEAFEADMISERVLGPRTATQVIPDVS